MCAIHEVPSRAPLQRTTLHPKLILRHRVQHCTKRRGDFLWRWQPCLSNGDKQRANQRRHPPPTRSGRKRLYPSSHALTRLHEDQPETPPSPSSAVPFRRDDDFVDRRTLLDQVHERCSIPASRTVLVGLGGSGRHRPHSERYIRECSVANFGSRSTLILNLR